jgi:release factor glutamine methyltransferase
MAETRGELRPVERRWLEEAARRRAERAHIGVEVVLASMRRRLARGEPLQYVLGWWSFRGHELAVDRRALIPRFETEQLVELVLARSAPGATVVDVGTGSGAIAIALALERPDLTVIATDLAPGALALARENARALGARLRIYRMRWLDGLASASVDVVVSNPPYVSEWEWATLDPLVREHEPRGALVAGLRGTEGACAVLDGARRVLRQGGFVALEVGAGQAPYVLEHARRRGYRDPTSSLDLAGIERFVTAQWGGMDAL